MGIVIFFSISLQVFRLVSGHVTLTSLQLILGVLEPKYDKEELMEDEDKEEGEREGEGSSSGDSDDGSSGERGEGEGGEGSEMDEDERGSLVSEDEVEQGEEEGEEVDPAFRAEVQRALGAAAVDSDVEVYIIINHNCYNSCGLRLLAYTIQSECCIYVDRVRAP